MSKGLSTQSHPRQSTFGEFIYPVLSRRSGGLSLGINLNLDKACNFSCVYCQVDRTQVETPKKPEVAQILKEIEAFLQGGHELEHEYLKDIAIAGDGEPTMSQALPEVMLGVLGLLQQYKSTAKLILFTNGAGITRSGLQPALQANHDAGGEVWFKLDFWDETSYHKINHPEISYQSIINHLKEIGAKFPLVLQSCLFEGQLKFQEDQYIALLKELLTAQVTFTKIQLYTLARPPKETWAKAMSTEQLETIAEKITTQIHCPVEIYK